MRLVTINVNGVASSLPQDFCSYPAGDKSMVEEAVAKAVEAMEEGVADRLAKAITKRKRDEENQRNTDSIDLPRPSRSARGTKRTNATRIRTKNQHTLWKTGN